MAEDHIFVAGLRFRVNLPRAQIVEINDAIERAIKLARDEGKIIITGKKD